MSPVSERTPDGKAARSRAGGTAMTVMRQAMQQVAQLTGRAADTVSAIERTDEGWRVEVELIELERVPSTTNILGTYEVRLDDEGIVIGYRRVRRYFRNAAEEG